MFVIFGIEWVELVGVRTRDGELYELDVFVLVIGFRFDCFVCFIWVIGCDGVDFDDAWVDGFRVYLLVVVLGFLNFFLLNGSNGLVGNFLFIEVVEW